MKNLCFLKYKENTVENFEIKEMNIIEENNKNYFIGEFLIVLKNEEDEIIIHEELIEVDIDDKIYIVKEGSLTIEKLNLSSKELQLTIKFEVKEK